MANSNSGDPDCSKLTVPQLKARCKELNITGYSKLGKAALLEKLAQHEKYKADARKTSPAVATGIPNETSSINKSPAPTRTFQAIPPPTSAVHPRQSDEISLRDHTVNVRPLTVPSKGAPIGLETLQQTNTRETKDNTSSLEMPAPNSAGSNQISSQKKRKLSEKAHTTKGSENVPPSAWIAKKLNCKHSALSHSRAEQPPSSTRLDGNASKALRPVHGSWLPGRLSSSHKPPPKRFQPLAPRAKSKSNLTAIDCARPQGASLQRLLHLDFSSAPLVRPSDSFVSITIPPSLAERKRVNAWAVILSGLSDAERKQCALVSRAIRYAVYLSAVPIIIRNFGARRFSQLPEKYNMSMTNFWPYVRYLRRELVERWSAYNASFLTKFFKGHTPVARTILGCPDNDKQLTVALRFLMTRLWFAISLNQADIERARSTIVADVQEIVKDEIWKVTAFAGSSSSAGDRRCSVFYVLESTCEVIGLPRSPGNPRPLTESELGSIPGNRPFLRTDWSDYIHHRISCDKNGDERFPLLYYLKTTNTEEYRNGISILWLKRISEEKEVGQYKRKIAERYILACVVGNSVSGKWMPSSHMAQVFAGKASESDVVPTSLLQRESQRVNLFLPAHHLVESIHFTTSSPTQDLHPALAIVQTPGREYFILRDNGMEVGCEEDGVWPVWRGILDCDARGVART